MLYCIVLLFREKRTQEKSRITFLSVYCNPFFFFFSDIFLDISRGLKIAVGKVCDISAKMPNFAKTAKYNPRGN